MSNERLRPGDLAAEIPRAFRGYDTAKVDDLLARAAHEIGRLSGELKSAQEQIEALRTEVEAFRQQESAIKGALISAQLSAEATRQAAEKEAERLIEETRQQALELQKELQLRTTEMRFELEKLHLEKQKFIGQFRAMLEHYLASVVEAGGNLEAHAHDSPNGHPLTVADSMSSPAAPIPAEPSPTAVENPAEVPKGESAPTPHELG